MCVGGGFSQIRSHISCLDKCTKKEVTHSMMEKANFVGLCCTPDEHIIYVSISFNDFRPIVNLQYFTFQVCKGQSRILDLKTEL